MKKYLTKNQVTDHSGQAKKQLFDNELFNESSFWQSASSSFDIFFRGSDFTKLFYKKA